MYKAIVYSEMKLKQYEDTQLSRTTFLWTKPPADVFIDFYLFNVTNPDGVMYYGEKPALVEIGPFSFRFVKGSTFKKSKIKKRTSDSGTRKVIFSETCSRTLNSKTLFAYKEKFFTGN